MLLHVGLFELTDLALNTLGAFVGTGVSGGEGSVGAVEKHCVRLFYFLNLFLLTAIGFQKFGPVF